MTQQTINVGTVPNDQTGDQARTAFQKVNANFTEVYAGAIPALSASTGSSLVGHIGAGTGAVATTVQAKLREIVSAKDFGAVGDGVTDDTAAIQAALNTGAQVRLEKLTYLISSALLIPSGGGLIGLGTVQYPPAALK